MNSDDNIENNLTVFFLYYFNFVNGINFCYFEENDELNINNEKIFQGFIINEKVTKVISVPAIYLKLKDIREAYIDILIYNF